MINIGQQFDILKIQQGAIVREIQASEDKRFFDLVLSYTIIDYLCKALREIPNTRWKKFKYYINRLFRRIK